LRDELKCLSDYWDLLKVRFHDAIELNIAIQEEKMNYLIPPLSLQFLIENAVKHNEASIRSPLVIEIKENGDCLEVINRIVQKPFPVQSEKVGLKNLQKRFTLLFQPVEYGVIDENFIVKLPLKKA
ncbi:MAG: histidine kinase, partial [Bacteroidota bacterium]